MPSTSQLAQEAARLAHESIARLRALHAAPPEALPLASLALEALQASQQPPDAPNATESHGEARRH